MPLYPSIGPSSFWTIQKTFELVQKCLDMGQKKTVIKSHFLATQKIFGSDQNNLILVQLYKT